MTTPPSPPPQQTPPPPSGLADPALPLAVAAVLVTATSAAVAIETLKASFILSAAALTAGAIHGSSGKPPIGKDQYVKMTGREDLHRHYLGVYHTVASAKDQGGQQVTGSAGLRRSQPGHASQHTADTLTRPHQTTDDDHVPYNSPATTPDPYSSNEGGGDFAAGMKEGREDAANGEKPTFSDNSSRVSPYVQGYAQGYFSGGAPAGQQDVPRSMGGDSGQAMNAGEAAAQWGVAKASMRRTAACIGCGHMSHLGEPCTSVKCRCKHAANEEGNGPGRSPKTIGKPASDKPGKQAIRVSAAFITPEASAEPDFRKAYRFAMCWRPGARLVRQGSSAFEAGLYSGLADRPVAVQAAWVRAHQRLASRHPALASRIEMHASFTRQFVLASRNRYLVSAATGCYPVTAATSVDLITDGPGTSPDPMGSTPLNGPGTNPPMGGQEDPAASGGPPPYQTVNPAGHGPVAPDDVLGTPQSPPSESGPFTQTYSGRHPGNADLAPVAPNLAGGAGYSNTEANQGNPGHMQPHKEQKALAFRRRVQSSLTARRELQYQ